MRPRVLIVDDEDIIREALATLLDDACLTVAAGGGRQALDILDRERIDLVLLDLRMPEMSGAEVVQKMRDRGLDVPIVLMSAHADVTAEASRLGIERFLVKPFDVDLLRDLIVELA